MWLPAPVSGSDRIQAELEALQAALGENIRRIRQATGRSQEEVAVRAGIDLKHWQRIEAGAVNPTLRTMVRVADALGVPTPDLLGTRRTGPIRVAEPPPPSQRLSDLEVQLERLDPELSGRLVEGLVALAARLGRR